MTKQASRAALFISTAANYIKNILNFVTPAKHIQSQEDLYDTLASEYATVATKNALNNLNLEANYKEQDYRYVTNDESQGGLLSLYKIIKNTGGTYSWQLMFAILDNGDWISVADIDLFNDLVLGDTFFKGDWASIADNGYGQTEVRKYIAGAWRTISKYTSVTLG